MSSIRAATCCSLAPLGDELRGRVDDGAQMAQHVRAPGPHRRLQQPAQTAAGEGLHVRRRQPDPLPRRDDRGGVGEPGQRVPVARVRAAHAGVRQPGQLPGGRVPQRGRPPRVGGGPAQVRDQRGQRQPAGRRARPADLDVISGQLGEEP